MPPRVSSGLSIFDMMKNMVSCGLTFELTGPLRRDGLARAAKMYRVPQAGPRQPAVVGPVVQRGVRPRLQGFALRFLSYFCQ